jgi:ribosomal protein L16 Arg81 hydroxylase
MQPGQILYVPAGFPHTTGESWSKVSTCTQGPGSTHSLASHFFYENLDKYSTATKTFRGKMLSLGSIVAVGFYLVGLLWYT